MVWGVADVDEQRIADATTAAICAIERCDRRGMGACGAGHSAGQTGWKQAHVELREVVNGLMYILSTGCQWRAIPKDLPPRSTLHDYFDRWSHDGTLERMHHALYVNVVNSQARGQPDRRHHRQPERQERGKRGPRSIRRATTRAKRSKARSGISSSIRRA